VEGNALAHPACPLRCASVSTHLRPARARLLSANCHVIVPRLGQGANGGFANSRSFAPLTPLRGDPQGAGFQDDTACRSL
jgi:hypothetical protein